MYQEAPQPYFDPQYLQQPQYLPLPQYIHPRPKKEESGWSIGKIVLLILGIIFGVILIGVVGIFIAAFTDESVDDLPSNTLQ